MGDIGMRYPLVKCLHHMVAANLSLNTVRQKDQHTSAKTFHMGILHKSVNEHLIKFKTRIRFHDQLPQYQRTASSCAPNHNIWRSGEKPYVDASTSFWHMVSITVSLSCGDALATSTRKVCVAMTPWSSHETCDCWKVWLVHFHVVSRRY